MNKTEMNEELGKYKAKIEYLRSTEFPNLTQTTYLDHAANGIYMNSLIEDYYKTLTSQKANVLFSNPHSHSESGTYTDAYINLTRQKILNLFNTNLNEYDCVFVYNATHALKLLAESFEFGHSGNDGAKPVFAYLNDNHTSVIGMREMVWKDCDVFCVYENELDRNYFNVKFIEPSCDKAKDQDSAKTNDLRNLFIYPAQSNFNGRKYSLNLVQQIKTSGLNVNNAEYKTRFQSSYPWFVCLDVASFVCTSVLDLSTVKPDFCVTSFYKLFGFPTGLGALLIRKNRQIKNALSKKSYFGGGTLSMALIDENRFEFRTTHDSFEFHQYFEDGTQSYLDIIAVSLAIEKFKTLSTRSFMSTIELYTQHLTKKCLRQLDELKHYNGEKLVEVYRTEIQANYGPIISFNLRNSRKKYIGYTLVNKLAQENKIQLRVGCFCNIGACQMHIRGLNVLKNFQSHGHKCGDYIDLINGVPTGAVRVSFGYCSVEEDLDKLKAFLNDLFIDTAPVTTLRQSNRGLVSSQKQYFKIKKIFIYPIKSCAPFEITDTWPLNRNGLLYDRNWILIDNHQIPLTQKRLQKMSKLKSFIDLKRSVLKLQYENESINIDLDSSHSQTEQSLIHICTHQAFGYDCGDIVAEWLKFVFQLDFDCRLVRISTEEASYEATARKSFTNQADFLMVSENSIRNLRKFLLSNETNDISDSELDLLDDNLALQFRPNFLIEILNADGVVYNDCHEKEYCTEFYEENWTNLRILNSHVEFQFTQLCTRCQMININQNQDNFNFNRIYDKLLKQLYKLKSNSKFGIYLTQLHSQQDPQRETVSLQVEPFLAQNNQISIGDMGTGYTRTDKQEQNDDDDELNEQICGAT